VHTFQVAIAISLLHALCIVSFSYVIRIRGWFLGLWTHFLLQDKVLAPCPTPNLEDQGISLSLDSALWPFRHGDPTGS
jgi:hypothetical protein